MRTGREIGLVVLLGCSSQHSGRDAGAEVQSGGDALWLMDSFGDGSAAPTDLPAADQLPASDLGDTGATDAPAGAVEAGLPLHDAAGDALSADFVPPPGCNYMAWERPIVSCNGQYDMSVHMRGNQGGCPEYYVFYGNGGAYADVDTLLTENGCNPDCLWYMYLTADGVRCGYGFGVDVYRAEDPACPIPRLVLPTTGGIFSSDEEMAASLPPCPDGGLEE